MFLLLMLSSHCVFIHE
uniref:Uncharacterized protein n=1 Tax=Anguilla anguilla TaxID=7936 RepID=A0A0E9PWK0_ANGAN